MGESTGVAPVVYEKASLRAADSASTSTRGSAPGSTPNSVTNSPRAGEGRSRGLYPVKSHHRGSFPIERTSSHAPVSRRSGKEAAGSTSTAEVETTSNRSCSRWRVSTCLMLPKGSVSVVNLARGVVSTEKSSSLWRGDSRGRRHRDMVHRRTGALYPNRDTCSMW